MSFPLVISGVLGLVNNWDTVPKRKLFLSIHSRWIENLKCYLGTLCPKIVFIFVPELLSLINQNILKKRASFF